MLGHSHDTLLSLPHTVAWGVPVAVLIASLIGSTHCVAMCGPLALGLGSNRLRLWFYNLGRMISYVALGAVAGGLGANTIGRLQENPWLALFSLVSIGSFLIFMGLRIWRGRGFHLRVPRALESLQASAWKFLRIKSLPKWLSAFLGGVFTIFLPCGHLYGFLIAAAATASTFNGAVFMFLFWLGTIPALAFGIRLLRNLLGPGLQARPRLGAALLVVAGFLSLSAFAYQVNYHALSEGKTDDFGMHHTDADAQISVLKQLRCH